MPVAGQSVTRGSRSFRPPETADGEVVRRLRAAGAIPIGITNVPELMIFPWTASAANGITRNPWDPTRTPGGSSGGSAAAVAAGMVPCATGSDGGGSIRIPAACCGLVGMKPSRGRVSTQPVGEGWLGLSVFGALARTVADSALLLDAIHGSLPADISSAPPFTGSYVRGRVHAARPAPDRGSRASCRPGSSRGCPATSAVRGSGPGHCSQSSAMTWSSAIRATAWPGSSSRRCGCAASTRSRARCPIGHGSSARRDSSSAPAVAWSRTAGAISCWPGGR